MRNRFRRFSSCVDVPLIWNVTINLKNEKGKLKCLMTLFRRLKCKYFSIEGDRKRSHHKSH